MKKWESLKVRKWESQELISNNRDKGRRDKEKPRRRNRGFWRIHKVISNRDGMGRGAAIIDSLFCFIDFSAMPDKMDNDLLLLAVKGV
jgi:hypothetical protein